MSSDPTAQTSREVIAQSAVERAQDGHLPMMDSHKIDFGNNGSYRSTLPMTFFDNTPFGKGDVAGSFVDFENGIIVLDFQEGDEYER